MNIAIIPARGGSKRIPKKNIRIFAEKPIIAWSIEAAIKSGLFDRVIVSTDDNEIAEISKQFGAEVPFIRPNSIADDYTGTNEVIKHAIKWLQTNGCDVEYICCIYATAPFIQSKYLKAGYDKLISSKKQFAFSVTSYPFPIQRAIRINKNGNVEAIYSEYVKSRSQDLEETYHDAGQFYWGLAEAFLSDAIVFSSLSTPVIIPRYLVQDIDTEEDWQRAEYMYKALCESRDSIHGSN